MDVILNVLLPYLISLAAGLRSAAIHDNIKRKFKDKLAHQDAAAPTVYDPRSLREQLRRAGEQAVRQIPSDEIGPAAEQILGLLADAAFQENLAAWLTSWRPKEKKEAETALAAKMIEALKRGGVKKKELQGFKERYFEMIERDVFSDQRLANWRLNLALIAAFERLDELEAIIRKEGHDTRIEVREQHRLTRQEVEAIIARQVVMQGKRFNQAQRDKAEQRYRELALESCDIMDLHNLPESDRHIATRQQELKLRRLYVPLRIQVEITTDQEPGAADMERIEKEREVRQSQRLEDSGETKFISVSEHDEDEDTNRIPPGKRLEKSLRLVLLGDPGSGKTTLLRWIATSYLLRLKQDPAWKDLPDVASLPNKDWLPILVRCRDLAESCKSGSIYDVLCETFRKAQLAQEEAEALQAVIVEKMAKGQALLLIDGLDEIAETALRARFCQQIERLQIAFPEAPIIVTSRIVGYREMKYRIGRGFEHAVVTGFTRKDEDDFARRWCEITELPERRVKAAEELIQAIHSSDRIERLAVNPMLLTTLALVKRKVGKLPERRADLYWEAVMVLLNWRSEVDKPIDHREAIPQLEYVAYEMCRRGVQRLLEDEIMELLERIRDEYPNLRAINNHEPADFLRLLERRTGILLEVGEVRHKGGPVKPGVRVPASDLPGVPGCPGPGGWEVSRQGQREKTGPAYRAPGRGNRRISGKVG